MPAFTTLSHRRAGNPHLPAASTRRVPLFLQLSLPTIMKLRKLLAASLFGIAALLSGCNESVFVPDASDLADKDSQYYPNLDVLDVTLKAVRGDKYSIADVNNYPDAYANGVTPEIKVHFAAADYPDDNLADNAKLRLRGSSSRLAPQKSYRIKLNSGIALWRGEQTLQINKHPYDLTRVRNKLAMDLFRDIPHLGSLRTQFVHLKFDDDGDAATPIVDYGLYTHVEKFGKEYLTNRGYDPAGNIYKAADFTFSRDARLQLNADGTPGSQFESVLEVQSGSKHAALMNMVQDVDSDSTDFPSVFGKYFNRNNYLTWLAVNILMGNRDTVNQNFALYQPAGGERFYFLPWDYDGALGWEQQPDVLAAPQLYDSWQLGLSNWWSVPLHRRFLMQPKNYQDLQKAVDEIYNGYLGKARLKAKIDAYRPLVEALITGDPDLQYLPTSDAADTVAKRKAEWAGEYERLSSVIDTNYRQFKAQLEKPMPFWQAAEVGSNGLTLRWEAAVDMQNDAVTYTVEIADQPDFRSGSKKLSRSQYAGTSLQVNALPAGTYYLRVIATDAKGNTQNAFDRHTDASGRNYFGVLQFVVAG